MNEIIDDRHPDWLKDILKIVEATSGSRKAVHDRISTELLGKEDKKAQSAKEA
jgi:hypothetical protein